MNYDILIIGAGPAGISAALYAKRANLNVAVIYSGESQLQKAHKIDNYYGFKDGITGSDLYEAGIEQAKNLGIEVIRAEVTGLSMDAPPPKTLYTVTAKTASKDNQENAGEQTFSGSALIIATGNKKLRPSIPGIAEFEGKGVSYCAVCDGFFYRGKDVCVIGDGTYAVSEAEHLSHMAKSVTVLTDGKDDSILRQAFDSSEKVKIQNRKIAQVKGDALVSAVEFVDETELECSGVFVALGSAGAADFAKKLGLLLDGDSIKVDDKMQTNAPGVYSAGNATGGLLQVCKAVYEGGVAGLSAVNYIRELKKA